MEEYKPNSYKSKEEQQEKKAMKVVASPVKTKKRGELRKLADIFISEDVSSVKSYILLDVLVPAIKKAISDIVTNGIDIALYGSAGRTKRNNASRVSYQQYYDRAGERKDSRSPSERTAYHYDDVVLDNRGDAEAVLAGMEEIIASYGIVSVADFYDLLGVTGSYTDNKYGWTDIHSATIVRVRDGYIIKLPKAMPLN